MINVRLIYKILGSLLLLETAFMAVCAAMAFWFMEDDGVAFLIALLVTLCGAFLLRYKGRDSDNSLSRRDAYLVVTLSWVMFSVFGTLPFLVGGYITNFTDAFFETMSGFSTTGATILDDVERLPHGILFWRSFTQWIGGLGIVFFTIAILPSIVGGSVKVFAAEATGPVRMKLHPKLSTSAKWIWMIYLTITAACAASYIFFGMGWFDALNYAMTTTATGGFSTHNTATAFFGSAGIEYTCIVFCFLSGINFLWLYYSVARLRPKTLFGNSEFKFYASLVGVAAVLIAAGLMIGNGYTVERAVRSALFQTVSFVTTTGLFNDDIGAWPHLTWIILGVCMLIGGCSGSTSGGLKCVRGVMLLKTVRNQFRQILHPNAVLPLKVSGENVPYNRRVTLLAFLTVTLLLCLFGSTAMMAMGVDNVNAAAITLGCLSNAGPSLGVGIGPAMSWSGLPVIGKWLCSLLMLVGRLEVFSVLVIFTPAFWKDS